MSRREKFRQGLSSLYLPRYDLLCSYLSEKWQPYCGLRTFEEQDLLWAKGRQSKGAVVTYARGGQSPHNYGCASDWCVFLMGAPFWPKSDDPIWDEYGEACKKAGLRWGGNFDMRDCPHNELPIETSWSRVLVDHKVSGMKTAQEFIEKNIRKAV